MRVLEGAPLDAREAADAMAAGLDGVHLAQTIGRTVVLYRAFPQEPEIELAG